MAIDSGDAFPYVVQTVADLIVPEEWTTALYHLKSKEEETGLVGRFPKAALTLADKLVGEQTHLIDAILSAFLEAIAAADSQLEDTAAFKRLALRAQ